VTLFNYVIADNDEQQKDKNNIDMYEYIIKNKQFLFCDEHVELYKIVRDKLQDMHYEKRIPWASNYYLLIFGNPLVEDVNGHMFD
jgi:hypothetical protein